MASQGQWGFVWLILPSLARSTAMPSDYITVPQRGYFDSQVIAHPADIYNQLGISTTLSQYFCAAFLVFVLITINTQMPIIDKHLILQ